MRYFKLIAGLLALLACAVSVAAQSSFVAVAPMQFRGPMPVVEVKLNGQGPFVFAIDTGGGLQADIDTSVAVRLNLQPTGRVLMGDPSGNNDRALETTRLDSISIGGAEFRNVTALIRPHRITADYPAVDGILGFALFTDYLLTLDYPAMQVRLARGDLPAANGADILTFEIENRVPVIEVAIGKWRVKAHIDSGNFVAGFILPEELVEQLPLLSQPVVVGRARSVSNQIEIKQVKLRDTIHVGHFDYPQATIAFPALSNTNVGFKILRDFALTFDQKNRRMKMVRG
ncbi:MAG TPA: aspartyl protease family protein [Pyrinomonadaceae bacterium]|nr:aspartyl protease family protein [Pyrinomonadaceae bacterium]